MQSKDTQKANPISTVWRRWRRPVLWLIIAIAALYVALQWKMVEIFYQSHRESIWLGVEEFVETITVPIKLARLEALEPVTAVPVPVQGIRQRDIADTWGEARSGGRSHEGVDIFAQRGTPVYAAAPGYIMRTGTNDLGGNIVFTVGPGGVRYYYAHLEQVSPYIHFGQEVTVETVLGYVGTSGNATGTPPHLHFGIYDNGPQNPYPLLIDR